jgi:UDP-N-acetylmuramoyl-tripeptide--D-alanyl-D-alanine ligase
VTPAIVLTGRSVAEAAGGRLVSGDPGCVFASVSIDTRTLEPGALFVAIRGERHDGAEFAGRAIEARAAGVMLPRGRAGAIDAGAAAVIEVDDTTQALQALARAVRRESGATVVAITGSAGKTTTKDVTAAFLEIRYRVVRNAGNLNNHIGLPLSLLELRRRPEMAVVELGMNHAGEVRTLVGIAEPDVRVWTNVGDAHLGFFRSVDELADAKAEILEGATPRTLVVANADDDRVVARVSGCIGRVVTFGIDRDADVRATDLADRGVDGMSAVVTTPRGRIDLTTRLVGRGNLANVLAAAAVAMEEDVPLDAVAARARTLAPAAHRGEVRRLGRGVTVIDDSYNASPAATKRALEVLEHSPAKRRVAILGEMLELGDHARPLHEAVGEAAARAGVAALVTVGGEAARAIGVGAERAGMPHASIRHAGTSEEAAALAVGMVDPGDVVLVKGSRGIGVDRVVARLMAELG